MIWIHCPGCSVGDQGKCTADGQCGKDPKWKRPSTKEELDEFAERISIAIFHNRREIKRRQEELEKLEPIFDRTIRLLESFQP